ncbi:hypothetical protein J5A66_02810 [Prevotella sp. oral taxon 475]|uniref:hypothetical protein n=1 Tax=Prevotella sp. oral taxon 475 TaxID=712471 RepID=UPI001BA9D859|nr:hypothetical protein [Prevotella sp. oral taxon 475]QUB47754.1 hypothetical protein J5A66_02810 [Prevotella sp. oral taxon 475]
MNIKDVMETEVLKKKISKAGEWMRMKGSPIIDLSLLTEQERRSLMKAVLK